MDNDEMIEELENMIEGAYIYYPTAKIADDRIEVMNYCIKLLKNESKKKTKWEDFKIINPMILKTGDSFFVDEIDIEKHTATLKLFVERE